MVKYRVVNEYFKQFKENLKYREIKKNRGYKYKFSQENKESKILKFPINSDLDASISKVKCKGDCLFEYIDKTDLLIIGLCLEGKKKINYKGENIIKKGEAFYFRPTEDFKINFYEHNFLYYFLDLNSFGKSFYSNNIEGMSYGDDICNKGEIVIEKIPYAIKSYGNKIKEIKDIEIENFLDYTNFMGILFNYLNWLIRLRVSTNSKMCKKRPKVCCISKAKKIIINNLEEYITVGEIAEAVGISIYKLQKNFKKIEGTTVYDYIRKSKIDYSKNLLEKSDLSIIIIAQKIGYENPSKFATAFKSITGYTPSKYRELKKD